MQNNNNIDALNCKASYNTKQLKHKDKWFLWRFITAKVL